jgi:MFS family permease
MAYRNATEEDLRALNMTEGYHKRLFNVYIDQMFKRRGSNHHYTPENTRAWLTWLAKRLVERRQTLFSIEDIQPGWLPISKSKRHLIFGLIFGLFLGPIFGLLYGLSDGLRVVLIMGLISGLTSGLIFGLIVGQNDSTKPTDKLTWSWKKARKWLIFGLVYGVIIGLGSGTGTLIGGLIVGLTIGLVVGMFGGLSKVTIEVRNTPAAGIRTSWKNYLLIWLIFALIVGLTIGMISWRFERLFVGLIFGIIGGLIFGLLYGGGFLIKHYISRWLLFRSGNLPWKLVDFLNYCTERIFLHKVGGGYIFIHRMLMEHFADMAQVREKSGIE